MSQLNITTLANLAGSETTPIADVINGSARAWVNFSGDNTTLIRASYNVDSVTDNGVGDYTVNFTNALEDSGYAFFANVSTTSTDANNLSPMQLFTPLTTSIRVESESDSGAQFDGNVVTVGVFR